MATLREPPTATPFLATARPELRDPAWLSHETCGREEWRQPVAGVAASRVSDQRRCADWCPLARGHPGPSRPGPRSLASYLTL
jgi:hypothetical protein